MLFYETVAKIDDTFHSTLLIRAIAAETVEKYCSPRYQSRLFQRILSPYESDIAQLTTLVFSQAILVEE